MRWTVVWSDRATNDLARFWLKSEHRRIITEACDRINEALATDPENIGEEFFEDRL